jgi:hypothetical protein
MPLLSLVYQFVVGGAIFFLGLFLSWRTEDYSWRKKPDRRILLFMVGGFVFYLVSQLLWHLVGVGKI